MINALKSTINRYCGQILLALALPLLTGCDTNRSTPKTTSPPAPFPSGVASIQASTATATTGKLPTSTKDAGLVEDASATRDAVAAEDAETGESLLASIKLIAAEISNKLVSSTCSAAGCIACRDGDCLGKGDKVPLMIPRKDDDFKFINPIEEQP